MFAIIIPLDRHELPGFGGGWGGGDRPDNSLPPIFHPGHPDHGLPSDPAHIWWGGRRPARPDQDLPGSPGHVWWGGRFPARPDQGLPPGVDPKTSMYAGAPESSIPEHPAAPNPDLGEWVLVAMGDRTMGWAWLDKTQVQPK